MRTPLDLAARERIRIDHDATLFVVAGAGTGKTTALVSRVVALVADGRTDLDDLAAITFTEAAAGELRDRIRSALDAAARGDDATVVDDEARARCAGARARIDDAALTTLHGFAQRLLARFPIEAGVPPRFDVIDEIEAAIAFDRDWRELAGELLADPALARPLLDALALDITMRHWREIAAVLDANWDRVPDVAAPSDGADAALPATALDVTALAAAITTAWGLRDHCDDPDDKLLARLARFPQLAALLSAAIAAGDADLLETVAALDLPTAGNAGRAANWNVPKAVVKSAIDAVIAARDECLERVGRAVVTAVAPRLFAWVRARARERAVSGRLGYHDLLVLARDLLRSDDTVRRAVAQRYRFVLIDEFQDTDPLQAELAALLAAAVDPTGLAWHEIDVEPGRLFFVGDPKQSIYRFRRADLLLYHHAAARFGEHAVELTTNFRSTPAIIEWVNDVFDGVLRDSDPALQAEPARLAPHRDAIAGHDLDGPAVSTFGAPDAESAAELRVREAGDIAAIVQAVVGRWRVVDPATGEARAARRYDIALLLPTRTSLDAIDRAFDDADIPARVESRALVFATSEVRDLLSALQAIDDPADAVAVVAALRSPGFGCSDRALAEWALAGGRWDYRAGAPDPIASEHEVAAAMAALHHFHDRRFSRSVSDTVTAVIGERGLDAVAVAHRRPRDRWRRTRFLLEQARAWDAAGDGGTLRGFVEWARRQADENATAIEMPAPESDDDAVRILTMHGAKGLEFPIVILGGLAATPPVKPAEVLFDDGGPLLRAGRVGREVKSAGYAEQREREKAHDTAERARLLYVAATRARDHLIVSQHYSATRQSTSFAAKLAEHLDRHPVPMLDIAALAGPVELVEPVTDDASAAVDPATSVGWDELVAVDGARRAGLSAAAAARAISATRVRALAGDAHDAAGTAEVVAITADDQTDVDALAERAPWARGRAGTAIGRAVHAVMQHVDLDDAAQIEPLARAQAIAERVPEHEAEIAALALRMHASAVVREAAARRHWREVPVATLVDNLVVEGYIDLLYEDARGDLVVVDYKTDHVRNPAELDDLVARYSLQAATYALALKTTLARPVARAVLLFAASGEAIAREVADLAGAVAEVRATLAAFAPASTLAGR